MKKLFSLLSFLLIAAGAWADYYTPSSAYTQGDAVIYATVATNELMSDAFSYEVGAFVDGVCIGNAKPMEDKPIYVIRARGNEDLVGKTIEFRAYNPSRGTEYSLTPSQTITFQLTGTYGYPSQLVTLTLKAATNYDIANIELEVGEEVNLLDYLTMTPSDATLPLNARWGYESYSTSGNISIEGNIMKGLSPDRGNLLFYIGPDVFGVSEYQVVKHATAINIITEEFQVNKGQSAKLTRFMNNTWDAAQAYELTPHDATDEVYWELKNDGIIKANAAEGTWTPAIGGTTQIRPYFINKSGTKVYPSGNKWITITVVVPLDTLSLSFPGGVMFANVGDDIYQRLLDHVTFGPSDATVTSVTFTSDNTDQVTISGTSAVIESEGEGAITVHANGLTASVLLITYDPLKEVTFAQNPLNIDRGTSVDEASVLVANNILGDMKSYQQGKIDLSGVLTGSGEYVDESMWLVNLTNSKLQKGSATVTVTVGWLDYSTNDEGTLVWGTPKSFVVNIGVSLNGMTITVTPNDSDPTTGVITLTPDPADADINWADFPVTVTSATFPDSWYCIQLTDNGNGQTSYTAKLPGSYTVMPVGGSAPKSFQVPYKAVQASGWQWCSNPYGRIDNVEENTFEGFFGDDFAEARTFNDLLINDPSWGLFGTMLNGGILQDEMYKLKMNGAHTGFIYGGDLDDIPEASLSQGWNWIGSPFFFNRMLANAISTSSLVKNMVIASKSDGSAEWDGTKWVGDLKFIKSGQGYLVYLPSAEMTMKFNNELSFAAGNEDDAPVGAPRHKAFSSPWQYDHTQFADNMTMVAKVEGILDTDRYTIGAFVGDECRGEGSFIDDLAFITVHVNGTEQVAFRLYDTYTGEFFDIDQTVASKMRMGSLDSPVRLSSQGLVTGINTIHADATTAETYDTNGRRTNTLHRGINIVRQSDGTVRKVVKR